MKELNINYNIPAIKSYWENESFISNGFCVPKLCHLITSQGCPGRCSFCIDDRFLGGRFYHSDDFVLDEIRLLTNQYKRRAFFFVDGVFRFNAQNIIKFRKTKIERDLASIPWSACLRSDFISDELAYWMKEAGCFEVFLGLESGSQKMLDLMQKDTSVEQNYNAMKVLDHYKILVTVPFIYGLPEQDEEDLSANMEFFKNVRLFDSACLQFTPTVGSKFHKELVKNRVLDPDDPSTWRRIVDYNAPLSSERNYSDIPFESFRELYNAHANHFFNTCSKNRPRLIKEYQLENVFLDMKIERGIYPVIKNRLKSFCRSYGSS